MAAQAPPLKEVIAPHRRARPLQDPDHPRWLNELGGHNDRGKRRRFWAAPQSAPTTTRAERALRPAVRARKVAPCAKTARGAQAVAAFTSVVRTLAKTGTGSRVDGVWHGFRSAKMPDASVEGCS